MTASVADFRALFPEFASASDYQVQFNLNLAYKSLRPEVWQDRLDEGALYYAAHYLYMGQLRAAQTAAATQGSPAVPGSPTGVLSSRSIDGVSYSLDVSVGRTEGAGSFNLSSYGQEYQDLLQSVCVGVVQL